MSGGRLNNGLLSNDFANIDIRDGEVLGTIFADRNDPHEGGEIHITGGAFNANDPTEYLIATNEDVSIRGGQFGYIDSGLGLLFTDFSNIDIFGRDLALEDGLLTGYLRDDSWISLNVGFGDDWSGEFNIHNAPEPPSYALLGIGLAGIGFMKRKKIKQ
jgi:hypothetical protein